MIEALSSRLANAIKSANPEETASYEVLRYGLIVFLNLFFIILFSVLASFFLDSMVPTLISAGSFFLLRFFSGGLHLKSIDLCTLVTAFIFVVIPYIPVPDRFCVYITAISFFIVLFKAPTNLKNTKWTDAVRPYFKMASLLIVSGNFFFNSSALALTYLTQSLLLLPKGGENNNENRS